jgi:hypothetical protein
MIHEIDADNIGTWMTPDGQIMSDYSQTIGKQNITGDDDDKIMWRTKSGKILPKPKYPRNITDDDAEGEWIYTGRVRRDLGWAGW